MWYLEGMILSIVRLNSFFSGIGGFEKGFESAGAFVLGCCERDLFCESVLKRHWPDVKLWNDIETVDGHDLGDADVWTAGFPCQDVSVARGWLGRDGLKGKRTGLFYTFLGLIEQRLPRVVLLENVTGLLSSHSGRDFAIVLRSLTDLGYGVAWRVLNARYFGSAQSRPRVFVCAWRRNVRAAIDALFESSPGSPVGSERAGFLAPSICEKTGAIVPEVAYCLAATSGRHTGTDWSRSYIAYEREVRRLTPTECEALQGFPRGWTGPGGGVKRPSDEIDTLRYHALGNAVCVPVAKWIAKRIVRRLRADLPATQRPRQDALLFEFASRVFGTPAMVMLPKEGAMLKWRPGGCAIDEGAIHAVCSTAPSKPLTRRLVEIIDKENVDKRYYLSPNAAEGILRRVESQNRTLFEPLHKALQRLSGLNPSETAKSGILDYSQCQHSSLFD
jgi:DNA (cytosine-5)-methyltransferase 1